MRCLYEQKVALSISYNGVYNMELDLDCFGEELFLDTAALSNKIMKDILKKAEKEE